MIRQRSSYREFSIRVELEFEQERSRRLVSELEELSREDPLTKLANRRAWDEALAAECARADRGSPASRCCCATSIVLSSSTTSTDTRSATPPSAASRMRSPPGSVAPTSPRGDEFAILVVGADRERAATLGQSLCTLVEGGELQDLDADGSLTVSIGVAEWEGRDDGASALMLRADRRLYVAKQQHNCIATSIDIKAA